MVQYGFGWGGSGVEIPPNLTTRFLIKMEKNGNGGEDVTNGGHSQSQDI